MRRLCWWLFHTVILCNQITKIIYIKFIKMKIINLMGIWCCFLILYKITMTMILPNNIIPQESDIYLLYQMISSPEALIYWCRFKGSMVWSINIWGCNCRSGNCIQDDSILFLCFYHYFRNGITMLSPTDTLNLHIGCFIKDLLGHYFNLFMILHPNHTNFNTL